MTVRAPAWMIVVWLICWMVIVAAVTGILIMLTSTPLQNKPLRTRPPAPTAPTVPRAVPQTPTV